jgi:hypothetical protein
LRSLPTGGADWFTVPDEHRAYRISMCLRFGSNFDLDWGFPLIQPLPKKPDHRRDELG